MSARSECEIRVRFCETDPASIVHIGRYADYIDVGKSEFFRKFQGKPRKPGDGGVSTVLVQTTFEYKSPARFDDVLVVETKLDFVKTKSFGFAFEIRNKDTGAIVCQAKAVHVCVSVETGKAVEVPESIRAIYVPPEPQGA
jgi:acyl-CoA thioester hydrolase